MSGSTAHGGGASPGGSSRVPALLIGHADFARALLAVAEAIAGPVDDIPCLSNVGRSPEELVAGIGAELDRLGSPVMILVDVAGGSCYAAARRASRGRGGTHLVTGVNLPLLLDFLQKRDRLDVGSLVPHVLERGRAGLALHLDGDGA